MAGSSPSVMGYSLREVEGVCLSDGTNCAVSINDLEKIKDIIENDYTNCDWYTADICPVNNGVSSLMTGRTDTQIRC